MRSALRRIEKLKAISGDRQQKGEVPPEFDDRWSWRCNQLLVGLRLEQFGFHAAHPGSTRQISSVNRAVLAVEFMADIFRSTERR